MMLGLRAMCRLASCALVASILGLGFSCATTGAPGVGDANLPNAGVGPFRELDFEEVAGLAPFVLDDSAALYREPAALDEGGDTLLYVVARIPKSDADPKVTTDAIVRTRSTDGRTFYGTSSQIGRKPAVVLRADAAWEGGNLAGPSALRLGDETLLFYAGERGIGLARSSDGLSFRKEPGPVFGADGGAAWESTPPRAPSVVALDDGRLRMFYASGRAIGEAESTDGGMTWKRVAPVPVLEPALVPPADSLAPNEKAPFDTAAVSDPCVSLRTTPAGRVHVRVFYTGRDTSGATAIGFAARYGEGGVLTRNGSPVYSANAHEAAPAFIERGGVSFLYVQQDKPGGSNDPAYPAIAGAVAPADVKLPPPSDFPDSP